MFAPLAFVFFYALIGFFVLVVYLAVGREPGTLEYVGVGVLAALPTAAWVYLRATKE